MLILLSRFHLFLFKYLSDKSFITVLTFIVKYNVL